MVFIKLQYKDNIKKILLAKEEISWQKICEILHQIFNLGDSASIRLLYKDEDQQSEGVIIKSNEDLLDTLNTKLMKKFVKFFVFYSGIVENDDTDILFTSLSQTNKQFEPINQAQVKSKEKDQGEEQEGNKQLSQQNNSNRNSINQQAINQRAEPKINHQNGLLQVESQEQLKTILSQAITKSNVFEKIKDQIRLFINEQSTSTSSNQPQNFQLDPKLFQSEDQASKIIEYSVQTNLQQLSDLFANNIQSVIEENQQAALVPIQPITAARKYSENLSDKPQSKMSKRLKRKPVELTNPKEKPIINRSDVNQESVYISEAKNRIRRSSTTGFGSLHEIVQTQQNDFKNIQNALEKSQKVTEQLINDQFDKSFQSIHHLFQSISSRGATPTGNSTVRNLSVKRTISAHELSQLLNKQVEQYASLNDSDDFSDDKDFDSPSLFDSLISEHISLKNQKVSFTFKPNSCRFNQNNQTTTHNNVNRETEFPSLFPKLLSKISEADGYEHLDRSQDEQIEDSTFELEDTIVHLSSPLKKCLTTEEKEPQSKQSGIISLVKDNHFYVTEEKKAVCQIDSFYNTIVQSHSNIDQPQHTSVQKINKVNNDGDDHPKLILTKKVSQKYSKTKNQKQSSVQI